MKHTIQTLKAMTSDPKVLMEIKAFEKELRDRYKFLVERLEPDYTLTREEVADFIKEVLGDS